MIFKTLFTGLWNYNKALFGLVMLFIVIQFYYSYQFACLALLVDNHKPVDHPYAFEAFPFVVYNMYSGKVDDWGKYSYLKIEADGQEVILTDLPVTKEDQFVNPSQKFITQRANGFNDQALKDYLDYIFNQQRAQRIFEKVSNIRFANNEGIWNNWVKKYLSSLLNHPVKNVKFFECSYTFDEWGKPHPLEQKLLYQFE